MRERLSQILKKADKFGHPVSLKYKQEARYKSEFGGLFTILMVLAIFGYFLDLMVNTLQQATYRVSTFIQKSDLTIDTTEQIVLDINNFDIAI